MLDHAVRAVPAQQYELDQTDHTDLPGRSRSSSGDRSSARRVQGSHSGYGGFTTPGVSQTEKAYLPLSFKTFTS